MRTRWLLPIIAALLSPGCGDDENNTLSPLVFCDQYAKVACEQLASACLFLPAECVANRTSECVAVGRASTSLAQDFIPANAESCLTKVRETYGKLKQGAVALKPAELQAMNAACANVYRGRATRNQSCASDADCSGTLICDKWHCGDTSLVAPGLGCANVGQTCTVGNYCGLTADILACLPKVGLNGACDEKTPCLESLRCAGGVCQEDLPIGGVCASDEDCATGFCEPYAARCAMDVRYARGSDACLALQTVRGTAPGPVFP